LALILTRHRFEAAWRGDEEKIRELTTGPWGPDNQSPLPIAVTDCMGWSPFFVACYKGNLKLAQTIAEIAHVQYRDPNADNSTYKVADLDWIISEDCHCYDSDSDSDDDSLPIEKVPDRNREIIENAATINNAVRSQISVLV
jgi:hypothetical protein